MSHAEAANRVGGEPVATVADAPPVAVVSAAATAVALDVYAAVATQQARRTAAWAAWAAEMGLAVAASRCGAVLVGPSVLDATPAVASEELSEWAEWAAEEARRTGASRCRLVVGDRLWRRADAPPLLGLLVTGGAPHESRQVTTTNFREVLGLGGESKGPGGDPVACWESLARAHSVLPSWCPGPWGLR